MKISTSSNSLAYHGSSKPFDCFAELVLAPDCPLAVTFSFCGRSTSISSSFGVTELAVDDSTSITSAILLMCHVDKIWRQILNSHPNSRGRFWLRSVSSHLSEPVNRLQKQSGVLGQDKTQARRGVGYRAKQATSFPGIF